jgi:4-hydroxythreonine-4-phosphate dehydrogenase
VSRPLKLHLTLGDPTGVGPEVVFRALQGHTGPVPVVHGHRAVWERAAQLVGGDPPAAEIREPASSKPFERPGEAQRAALEQAVRAAGLGEVDALVTAPVDKAALRRAGFAHTGHTPFLAEQSGTEVAMMFAGPSLRVVLATIHIPLATVAKVLTRERLVAVIRLGAQALIHDFGLERPSIAVAGLNPHAGEQGLLGKEEETLLGPAIAAARADCQACGLEVSVVGPLPGDTVFLQARQGAHDAVVACYHDQGLIPVKLLEWSETVNVTLGLPYVRTSPGHGTGREIAWSGRADGRGMAEALRLACDLAKRRQRSSANNH